MLEQLGGGESTVDFHGPVGAVFCALDHFGADVRGEDVVVPGIELGEGILEHDRDAVGLLAAGAAGTPNAEGSRVLAGLDEAGEDVGLEGAEGMDVPVEGGGICGHDVDHFFDEKGMGASAEGFDEVRDGGEALAFGEGSESGVDEVILFVFEDDGGLAEDDFADVTEILRGERNSGIRKFHGMGCFWVTGIFEE